jgi:hypothetical protein
MALVVESGTIRAVTLEPTPVYTNRLQCVERGRASREKRAGLDGAPLSTLTTASDRARGPQERTAMRKAPRQAAGVGFEPTSDLAAANGFQGLRKTAAPLS